MEMFDIPKHDCKTNQQSIRKTRETSPVYEVNSEHVQTHRSHMLPFIEQTNNQTHNSDAGKSSSKKGKVETVYPKNEKGSRISFKSLPMQQLNGFSLA